MRLGLRRFAGAANGDAQTLDGLDSTAFALAADAFEPVVDTRANVLASTPANATIALCSDTLEFALWNGAAWYFAPLELTAQVNAIDMGLTTDLVANDRAGYSADYITDKSIYNSRILGSEVTKEGSIRTSSSVLQVYLSGVWKDIVTGFRFREDPNSGYYELEHKPIGFTQWIELMSGNSDDLGLNGLPMTQGYATSMGAFPVHQQIVGREITA